MGSDGVVNTEILLTEMSTRTPMPGSWNLPGGGIDHGEHPRDAVVREVYEETGLRITPGPIIDVSSTHFTGMRHDGLVEDFHGLHVVYEATLLPESMGVTPQVLELDSSTERAEWILLSRARSLKLLAAAAHALASIK